MLPAVQLTDKQIRATVFSCEGARERESERAREKGKNACLISLALSGCGEKYARKANRGSKEGRALRDNKYKRIMLRPKRGSR